MARMEVPDDAEDASLTLIGAMRCVRDLLSNFDRQFGGEMAGVDASDFGRLMDILVRNADHAHQARFGDVMPTATND